MLFSNKSLLSRLGISWLHIIIAFVVLLLILYVFRPFIHPVVMNLYRNPLLILLFITVIIFIITFVLQLRKVALIVGGIALILVVVISLSPLFVQLHIVSETDYAIRETFYESQSYRVVPQAVAQRYGHDNLQKSRETLGDFRAIVFNDTQYWVAPRIPNSPLLYFIQKVEGLMLVNAESVAKQTRLIDQRFQIGERIGVFDNVYWNLLRERYFIDFAEMFYVHDPAVDEFYLVAPYISYEFRFPVMVPTFGGLFIVKPDGTILDISPQEITQYPFLENTRVYPEKLALLKVESYAYKNGLFNAWFLHEDQIEVTQVPNAPNAQPFLMSTTGGLKWIVAAEPYGQSRGVFKLFFVDAQTGDVELVELDPNNTLLGPVRVVSFVRSQFPTIDWSVNRIIEPRPFVQDNELYWLLSIVPNDYAGIARTVLVNARTNELTVLEGSQQVRLVENQTSQEVHNQTPTIQQPIVSVDDQSQREQIIREKLDEITQLLAEVELLLAE